MYLTDTTATNITTSRGIEVLNDANVTLDTTDDKTIYVVLNGGTLTVNTPNATVYSSGEKQTVNVNAVDLEDCYHESGTVLGNINLLIGRLIVDDEAKVSTILVTASKLKDVSIEIKNSESVGAVAATSNEIASVLTTNKTKFDIPTQIVNTTVVNQQEMGKFAGGLGTKESPYLVETPAQFAEIKALYADKVIGTAYTGKTYHFKQVADLVLSMDQLNGNFTGTYDGGNHSISFDETVYSEKYIALFKKPFNGIEIRNINMFVKANQPVSVCYSEDWYADAGIIVYENIVIDSNGETVKTITSNFGFLQTYTTYNYTGLKVINCVNKANIESTGVSLGVFIGDAPYSYNSVDHTIEFTNCVNEGNITGTDYVGVLYGNGSYVGYRDYETRDFISKEYNTSKFIIKNIVNKGTIVALNSAKGIAAIAPCSEVLNNSTEITNTGLFVTGNYFDGKEVTLDLDNAKINVSNSENVTFKVAYRINQHNLSNTIKFFYDLTIDSTLTENNINKFKVYSKAKAREVLGNEVVSSLTYDENGIAFYTVDNQTYLVVNNADIGNGTGESGLTLHVFAYNASGVCVGTIDL